MEPDDGGIDDKQLTALEFPVLVQEAPLGAGSRQVGVVQLNKYPIVYPYLIEFRIENNRIY